MKGVGASALLCLSVVLPGCVQLQVYGPAYGARSELEPVRQGRSVEVVAPQKDFARIRPFLLGFVYKGTYPNAYGDGSPGDVVRLETASHDYFSHWPVAAIPVIRVRHFRLESIDRCTGNRSEVELEIDVMQRNGTQETPVTTFSYRDAIDSAASDCTCALVSLPAFVGWVWYAPYLGWRGDREDQLNLLGGGAFFAFFESLEANRTAK